VWDHYIAVLNMRRFERLLAGPLEPARREVLENLLEAERLKLLGRNAAAVDPARLFHGPIRNGE